MKYTTNYEMKLPEDTDELDVDVLDENFESIDGKIYSEAETRQAADETTASSSIKGHVKLSASTTSSYGVSSGYAATPSAVKAAYDRASTAITNATTVQENLDNVVSELEEEITANAEDIAANTENISANAEKIAANTENIATNTENIATNAENIATNTENISLKANIASPTFTGTPKAPTPSTSTNSTQIATTAFVQSLISTLTAKVESLAASIVDITYYLLWVNLENYAVCDDFDDYTISYSDYSTDEATTSAILRVESDDERPESISATVFFISWSGGNDDEIYNAQALLYPDGTVYTRGRYLRVYNTGVASNPTWSSWSADNTGNEWNSTYAKSLFSA